MIEPPPEDLPPPPAPAPPVAWHARPYLHLALSIVFSAAAQPLLKHGADQVHAAAGGAPAYLLPLYWLKAGWVWAGIAAIVTSLLSWLQALRTVPLNIAMNLAGVIQIMVPLASWAFLGEHIGVQRWAGILLVTLGVAITAKEAVRLEEKL